jgi:sulfoxide reductase catalytic subunit YedY
MGSRRQFLKITLGVLSLLGLLAGPFSSILRSALAGTKKIILPKNTRRESLIDKNPAELDARHLEITPLKDFGIMGLDDHRVTLKDWRLEVDGNVENALSLTHGQILDLPAIERPVLQICPGVFVNHGRWKGVSLHELLERAGAGAGVTHVTVRGPRGDYENTQRFPIEDIRADRVFLAYQINGEILPVKHGFPIRAVAEGYYGFDWIKYVYRVTAEKV